MQFSICFSWPLYVMFYENGSVSNPCGIPACTFSFMIINCVQALLIYKVPFLLISSNILFILLN